MKYYPLTDVQKKDWIEWANSIIPVLEAKAEVKEENGLFDSADGDVATAKDLVGTCLAVLTNAEVSILDKPQEQEVK